MKIDFNETEKRRIKKGLLWAVIVSAFYMWAEVSSRPPAIEKTLPPLDQEQSWNARWDFENSKWVYIEVDTVGPSNPGAAQRELRDNQHKYNNHREKEVLEIDEDDARDILDYIGG